MRLTGLGLERPVRELLAEPVPMTVPRFQQPAPVEPIQSGGPGALVGEEAVGRLVQHGLPGQQVKEAAEAVLRFLRGLLRQPSLEVGDRNPVHFYWHVIS
jgi:hypothetical protein